MNDEILSSVGEPVLEESGASLTRQCLYFQGTIAVFESAGFEMPLKKREAPAFVIEQLLGALVRVREQHIVVHPDKRQKYISELLVAEVASPWREMC